MPKVSYSTNPNKRHYHQVAWTDEEDKQLSAMFSVMKPTDLVSHFGLNYEQIRTRARTLNLDSKKTVRRKNINHDFFSTVNIESSYWAGFLMADGNIRGNKIWIGLGEKDKPHLEEFAKALNLTEAVRCYSSVAGGILKGRNYTRVVLEVGSKKLVEAIQKNFSVFPQKTLKPYIPPPHVRDNFAKAFIAGLIDGDGFINFYQSGKYIRFGFMGAEEICTWAADVANEALITLGRKPTTYVTKSQRGYWEIRCVGKNAQILLNEMQGICENSLLQRKWNNLKIYNESKSWQRDKTKSK
jgi:hypothetical protein